MRDPKFYQNFTRIPKKLATLSLLCVTLMGVNFFGPVGSDFDGDLD